MQLTFSQLMQAEPENVVRLARALDLPVDGTQDQVACRIIDANLHAFSAKQKQEMIAYWEGMAMSESFIEREAAKL